MSNDRQSTIWGFVGDMVSARNDVANRIGPYALPEAVGVCRYLDCSNYSACLDHAASKQWRSFTCEGCRKSAHGEFLED
jgi:hypothetical protein